MSPKNQIVILKALMAIEGLSKSTAITILLNSDAGFNSIIGDVITMKYKLSMIEQLINEIKAENKTS